MKKVYKEIESPLSVFNNIILEISGKLEKIYLGDLNIKQSKIGNIKPNIAFTNQLLFEEKSITICNSIKLVCDGTNFGIKFLGIFDDLQMIEITIKNQKNLYQIFQHYLFLTSAISNNNYDSFISLKFIESIHKQFIEKTIDYKNSYLVPYKNKIYRLYDKRDKTLDELYNRFSYIVRFQMSENGLEFNYWLIRCVSTDLNESKSLENIKFEEIDILKNGKFHIDKAVNFLTELFYYGEIKN